MKQFTIPSFFRSSWVGKMKAARREEDRMKKDFTPYKLDFQELTFFLPRHFGFCYGVENAIDIIYKALEEQEGKHIYVLSELIHNTQVNADLEARGVRFLMDTYGRSLIPLDSLQPEDVVIIPAFGTDLDTEARLKNIGVDIQRYNTTCPFVKRVWNKVGELAHKKYTIILHGKHYHEETRATFSRVEKTGQPCVMVRDQNEALSLIAYLSKKKNEADFFEEFAGKYTTGFQPYRDLQRVGVVNQTTMLSVETQEIALLFKEAMKKYFPSDPDAFADTRDTLCYATNDNQTALAQVLATTSIDMAFVIGGHKSSNTTNLFRYSAAKVSTYFIVSEDNILSDSLVKHFDYQQGKEVMLPITPAIFDGKKKNILLILGASCPDILVDRVITKILSFRLSEADLARQITHWGNLVQ